MAPELFTSGQWWVAQVPCAAAGPSQRDEVVQGVCMHMYTCAEGAEEELAWSIGVLLHTLPSQAPASAGLHAAG